MIRPSDVCDLPRARAGADACVLTPDGLRRRSNRAGEGFAGAATLARRTGDCPGCGYYPVVVEGAPSRSLIQQPPLTSLQLPMPTSDLAAAPSPLSRKLPRIASNDDVRTRWGVEQVGPGADDDSPERRGFLRFQKDDDRRRAPDVRAVAAAAAKVERRMPVDHANGPNRDRRCWEASQEGECRW